MNPHDGIEVECTIPGANETKEGNFLSEAESIERANVDNQEIVSTKTSNTMEESNEPEIFFNIPKITFRSFFQIAKENENGGTHLQTLCYLLGPEKKTSNEDIWIDLIVVPKQTCTPTFVEDEGIEGQSTFDYLNEWSMTKNKKVYAWLHSRAPGPNSCEFSSIDMHSQFLLEKYVSKDIVGIIIQIMEEDYIWNAMRLNKFGRQRVEFCCKNFNNPFEEHKSCACDCLYDSCRDNIKPQEEIPFYRCKVGLSNFMKEIGPENPRYTLAREPPSDKSDFENQEEEVSCENCNEVMERSRFLRHIGKNEKCKNYYGPRFDAMKRKKKRHNKRLSRQRIGTDKELKKQRDNYKKECKEMELAANEK
jgi:hypothetical protein